MSVARVDPLAASVGAAAEPSYRLFTFGSRPVIAVPIRSAKFLRAGIRCYQGSTIRKTLFRNLLVLAATGRWDRLIAPTIELPLPRNVAETMRDWLDSSSVVKNSGPLSFVVRWPLQAHRRRVYVHVLDGDGTAVCFVKVSLDDETDEMMLREAAALTALGELPRRHFEVPRLLGVWRAQGHVVLALGPLPVPARRRIRAGWAFPTDAVREYATGLHTLSGSELVRTSWYRDGIRHDAETCSTFYSELSADQSPARVGRAHGDFGEHNILRTGTVPWIFDWEDGAVDAPVLTDLLGFALTGLSRKLARNPQEWCSVVQRRAPMLNSLPRRDLMLALVYRKSRRMSDAGIIMNNWRQSNGWGR